MANTLSSIELSYERALSECGFLAVSVLLFVVSTAAAVAWCDVMPAMSEMPMAWMLAYDQTWWGFAAPLIDMWAVMIAAMTLPLLLPTLQRCRSVLYLAGKPNVDTQTALAGAGYFTIWTLIGVMVPVLDAALAQFEITRPVMAHVAPPARDTVVLTAGALQFSAWKTRQRI